MAPRKTRRRTPVDTTRLGTVLYSGLRKLEADGDQGQGGWFHAGLSSITKAAPDTEGINFPQAPTLYKVLSTLVEKRLIEQRKDEETGRYQYRILKHMDPEKTATRPVGRPRKVVAEPVAEPVAVAAMGAPMTVEEAIEQPTQPSGLQVIAVIQSEFEQAVEQRKDADSRILSLREQVDALMKSLDTTVKELGIAVGQ